ncbi:VOC family protein [Actinomycetospora endophytica]|uniref:VOC family protein n=1 Tax=Actinomycetospora endophytica TaxID=2291215 RepID=A0ABS8P7S0_9PSEU|nr:VOC family protein [Actinomycetospora endophytica]MCD2194283.1 VOC family protein [Actinomycetospora endophytica]
MADVQRQHCRIADTGGVLSRLHHVQLAMPAGREDDARAFFVGVLGMTEIDKPPVLAARGGAWFRAGGVEIHLGVEPDFAPARKAHPGLVVDDLDDAARRVATTGQDVGWDAEFPGFRRFYAHDPFGNRLEFLQPLD